MSLQNKKILLTGGAGFLGSHVLSELLRNGVKQEDVIVPRSSEYDLRDMGVCTTLTEGVDVVIHLAAHVGGIAYNSAHPGTIYYDNALMALNIIEASRRANVGKFVGIGSVCAYPKNAPVPACEEDLWNGYPEESNGAYGSAKRGMLVQSQAYRKEFGMNAIHLLLVNMYGPGDDFDPASSHVIPALIRKIAEAKAENAPHIDVWGTGSATREFLFAPEAARAIALATAGYDGEEPVNVGSGEEVSIRELVMMLVELMEYQGDVRFDTSRPDGQPRRRFSSKRAREAFGFVNEVALREGLLQTIDYWMTLHTRTQ